MMTAMKQRKKTKTSRVTNEIDLLVITLDLTLFKIAVETLNAQVGVGGRVCFHRVSLPLDGTKSALGLPSTAAFSEVWDAALLEIPLLDRADNVDGQLTIALECLGPVGGDLVAGRELAGDRGHEHLAHLVVLVGLGVDVLDSSETRVGRGGVVEFADDLDDVLTKFVHFELLSEEVQI